MADVTDNQAVPCICFRWGYDKLGRPLLWAWPSVKDWRHLNVQAELAMHVAMAEVMCASTTLTLPSTVTYTIVADGTLSFRQISPSLMKVGVR